MPLMPLILSIHSLVVYKTETWMCGWALRRSHSFSESLHKLRIKITLQLHQPTFLPTSGSPCRLKAARFLKMRLPEHEQEKRPLWSEEPAWPPPCSFFLMRLYKQIIISSTLTHDMSILWLVGVCVCVVGGQRKEGQEWDLCWISSRDSVRQVWKCSLLGIVLKQRSTAEQIYRTTCKGGNGEYSPSHAVEEKDCVCVCDMNVRTFTSKDRS